MWYFDARSIGASETAGNSWRRHRVTKVVRHMVGLRADVAAATRSSPSPADARAGMLSPEDS